MKIVILCVHETENLPEITWSEDRHIKWCAHGAHVNFFQILK
jgi:hypothetical protein